MACVRLSLDRFVASLPRDDDGGSFTDVIARERSDDAIQTRPCQSPSLDGFVAWPRRTQAFPDLAMMSAGATRCRDAGPEAPRALVPQPN
jgi:hypothetical protein